jgi:hypothetical protein
MSLSTLRQVITSDQLEAPEALRWDTFVATDESIRWLWESLQKFPYVFDDFGKGNFDDFMARLLNPTNVFINIGPGLGIGAGFAVRPGLDALLHIIMFDGRLRGREALFLEIMGYFFRRLRLRRMTTMIVEGNRTAIKLAERLGFTLEGTMRGAARNAEGGTVDVHIYGILREEYENVSQSIRSVTDTESAS